MIYYAVLVIATVLFGALSLAVWRKTRQVAFLVGFACLYYWSLYGGWLVVNRGMGSTRAYRFEYLFYKLFPIYLDEYYLWTLILYAMFVIAVQVTVVLTARRMVVISDAPPERLCVSHGTILTLSAVMTLGAYAIVWDVVSSAASTSGGYGAIGHGTAIPLASVYQILHQSALTFVLMGLSVAAAGPDARYLVGRPGLARWGYVVLIPAIFALNVLMGNRSMLVFGAAGSGLFYLVNAPKPSRLLIVGGGVLAVSGVLVLGIIRSAGGQRELGDQNVIGKIQYTITEALSQDVEAFAAHASLYGTLQKHVPLTYGSSLLWLATSIIPGAIRPDLVPLAYFHYAASVGASPDQGFTLHHAAGWYINFGVAGLVAGAVLLGGLWAALFNMFVHVRARTSQFARVFATVAFWNLTAYFPIVIRSGPEGYKGVGVECLLIPTLLMMAASMQVARVANRLCLVPLRSSQLRSVTASAAALMALLMVTGCSAVDAQAVRRDWYAAPDGAATGDGSRARPLSLAAALDGRRISAGSTVWLLGGTYRGNFSSTLTGTAEAPIVVRQHPSGRAVIADERERATGATISIKGAWTTYRDFEVTNLNEQRGHGSGFRPMGFEVQAPHTRFIHLTVHDTGMGFGFWKEAIASELYGNVIFNCGTENSAADSRHGHGIYAQNDGDDKLLRENIIVNQYGFGLHLYPNPGAEIGFRLEGNVVANSGTAHPAPGVVGFNNILVSTYRPYRSDRIELIENFTYLPQRPELRRRFTDANVCLGCTDPQINGRLTVRGNYFAGGAPVAVVAGWQQVQFRANTLVGSDGMVAVTPASSATFKQWDFDDNDYVGSGPPAGPDVLFALAGTPMAQAAWRAATGFDQRSRFSAGRPLLNRVFVRRSLYEPGRGHVIVYNWQHLPRATVDLSTVLSAGARYEIRSAMDYLGVPVAVGRFDQAFVSLPLRDLAVAPARGARAVAATGIAEFAVFVVRTVAGDADTTATPPPAPPPSTLSTTAAWVSLAGHYASRTPAAEIRIVLAGDELRAVLLHEPGQPSFPLVPVSGSRFRVDGAEGYFITFQMTGRIADAIVVERPRASTVTLVRT